MLCLDESTPVILALSLVGAVLLIVGGSLWGSGQAGGNFNQMAAGVGLFCASVVLLMLAGIGCWCNKCFCTPQRKSWLAERFYSPGRSRAKPGAEVETAATDEDTADCGSLGSSFRSFRSSRRSVRRSARRDRVQPADSAAMSAAPPPDNATTGSAAKVERGIPEQSEEPSPPPPTQDVVVQQTSIDDVPTTHDTVGQPAEDGVSTFVSC